jgi:hypothetical protein
MVANEMGAKIIQQLKVAGDSGSQYDFERQWYTNLFFIEPFLREHITKKDWRSRQGTQWQPSE